MRAAGESRGEDRPANVYKTCKSGFSGAGIPYKQGAALRFIRGRQGSVLLDRKGVGRRTMEGECSVPVVFATGNSRCRARPVAALLVLVLPCSAAWASPALARAASAGVRRSIRRSARCASRSTATARRRASRPLKVSAKLTKAAKWMSLNMATNDYFDHADSLGRNTVRPVAQLRHTATARRARTSPAGWPGPRRRSTSGSNDPPHRAGMLRATVQGDRHRARLQRRLDARLVLDDDVRHHHRRRRRLLTEVP